jgi:hypothetical protein
VTPRLKPITLAGVPTALQKAERYRLLNEPSAAESICLDVLEVDAENQQAAVMLLLSITDRLGEDLAEGVSRARAVLPRLSDEYKRLYYSGIICERRATAQLRRGAPGAAEIAYDWLVEAMEWYERAERIRPAGNDESILRWNTCVRILSRDDHLKPRLVERFEPSLE